MQLVSADFDFAATVTPRHNAANPLDADADGQISPGDALLVINVLSDMAEPDRTAPLRAVDFQYSVDIDGDGSVTRLDAIYVVNYLNASELLTGMVESVPTRFASALGGPFRECPSDGQIGSGSRIAGPRRVIVRGPAAGTVRQPAEWFRSSGAAARKELRQQEDAGQQGNLHAELHDRLFVELGRWRT